MQSKPTLSIIIVNWNGAKFLKGCLDSILEIPCDYATEIILLDNASTDNSHAILAPYESRITLIKNPSNVGFSKGNNLCLPYAKGKYLLLLNNDTVLKENALNTMVSFFEAHPEIGAISPKLLNADGSIQIQGSSLGAWRFKSKTPRTLPFICGAALMTTRALYTEIGGLDENLFFYNDDIDFCKQMQKRKKDIYYLPDAQVTHFGGLSTKFRKAAATVDGYRGSLYLSRKFYPLIVHIIYRFLVLVDASIKAIVYGILSLFFKKAQDYFHAYRRIIGIVFSGQFIPPRTGKQQ
jgi:GT2 family glycosyltransferase